MTHQLLCPGPAELHSHLGGPRVQQLSMTQLCPQLILILTPKRQRFIQLQDTFRLCPMDTVYTVHLLL